MSSRNRNPQDRIKKLETVRKFRNRLEDLQRQMRETLRDFDEMVKTRAAQWECAACGKRRHFTAPMPLETAAPCPECGGGSMKPILPG